MERFIEFVINHWVLSSLFVFFLVTLLMTESRRGGNKVSAQLATMMLNRDEAVIVDVRDSKEFREGHITGAINIPFGSLKDKSKELERYKEKTIIVADKMGQHAGMAGSLLRTAGFDNVSRLEGGITEWRNANLPLIKG